MRSFVRLTLICLVVCFVSHINCTVPVRHLKRLKNDQHKLDNIFDKATMERTQSGAKLYLKDRVVSLLNVPEVMQATEYTCGPASLLAVLSYYRLDDGIRESVLAEMAQTSSKWGTSPQNLYNTVQRLGINVEMRENMTIADLQHNVQNNQPTIILFQAWADEGTSYKNDWDDGHYVVVIGYDKEYLYFEDPWILGSIGYIEKNEFLQRWHDIVGGIRRVYNLGITVKANKVQKPVVEKLE